MNHSYLVQKVTSKSQINLIYPMRWYIMLWWKFVVYTTEILCCWNINASGLLY